MKPFFPRLSVCLGVLVLIAACGQATPATAPVDPPIPSLTPSTTSSAPVSRLPTQTEAAPTSTSTPVEPRSPGISFPEYELSAEIDHAGKTVRVDEIVRYINSSPRLLDELVLIAEPNRYPGGFDLGLVEEPSGSFVIDYSLSGNQLRIQLEPSLASGEQIQLHLQFELALPAIPPPSEMLKPQPYGYTERQMNLVDWYLFAAPLAEDGEWLAHKPSYFGEFLVYPAANFRVEILLRNAPAGLLVAASAENRSGEAGRYVYELQAARTFALSLNSGYEMTETTVRGVKVRSYFAGFERAAGEAALDATARALELYSDLYGAYPRQSLSVVEADFLDGMEFDGLYFLSRAFYNLYDGSQKGYLTFIAVHETAHQWFFGQVGNDQALEPWLDEAWCTFSELLYYERYYPELVDWWWYYRVNFYEPAGPIDQPVYDYPGFTAYRNAVYLRGAQFLFDLRENRGADRFYALTRAYLEQFDGRISTARGFFEVFGLPSGGDQELIARYFRSVE